MTAVLERVPECELMLGEEQADAYAAADLSELQQRMVSQFTARFGALDGGRLLDLGCGAADMTIRFAAAFTNVTALGVDGSPALLRQGESAVRSAGLERRVRLELRHLPDAALEQERFDVVIANSLLHHLADPATLWSTIARCAKPGAPVLVMDLRRPDTMDAAEQLVAITPPRHARCCGRTFSTRCTRPIAPARSARSSTMPGCRIFRWKNTEICTSSSGAVPRIATTHRRQRQPG